VFGVPPVSRTYWRSLGQIADSPEYRAALEREFPEGASELPEGVTRREMMMLLGAFIVYQSYRLVHAFTVGMLILTLFDLIVVVLTWREYGRQRERLSARR